jgi:hypothetical protein
VREVQVREESPVHKGRGSLVATTGDLPDPVGPACCGGR